MTRRIVLPLVCSLMGGSLAVAETATPFPLRITYQGRLLNGNEAPAVGPITIDFSIRTSVGTDPSVPDEVKWTGRYVNVPVSREGTFFLVLGDPPADPIPVAAFDGPNRFLSIAIDGGEELKPRQRIASTPYAYVTGTALSLDGLALPDLDARYEARFDARYDARYLPTTGGAFVQLAPSAGFGLQTGHATLSGTVTAGSFVGDGVGVTGVRAATAVHADVAAKADALSTACNGCVTLNNLQQTNGKVLNLNADQVDGLSAQEIIDQAKASSSGVATSLNCTGCVTASSVGNGSLTLNKLSGTGCSDGQALTWSPSDGGWACKTISSGGGGPSLPLSIAQGGTGKTTRAEALGALLPSPAASTVLSTDGTNVSWLAFGNGANNLLQLDSQGRLPVVDGSQLTNVNASQLRGRPVSTTLPGAGQVLSWNGSAWAPATLPQMGQACDIGANVVGFAADGTIICSQPQGFVKVVAAQYHSCALMVDKTVRCWGYGSGGRLGNKSTTNWKTPVAVKLATGSLQNVIDIAAGFAFTCAVVGASATATSGQVFCWGDNGSGQLGDGTTTDRNFAVAVTGITNAVAVTTGYLHACARLENGRAKCWGNNGNARLGNNGGTANSSVPTDVYISSGVVGSDITDISAGQAHTCIVRAVGGGSAYCWGANGYGQLGDNSTTAKSMATAVAAPFNTSVKRIVAGVDYDGGPGAFVEHTCGIKTTGEVYCWGRGNRGQLGNGGTAQSNVPVQVQVDATDAGASSGMLAGATDIAVGGAHTCAIANPNATAYCWGHNGNYQTASTNTNARTRAIPMRNSDDSDTLQNATSIAASRHTTGFSLVVTQDPGASSGVAWGMGYNGHGEMGDGTTTNTAGLPTQTNTP